MAAIMSTVNALLILVSSTVVKDIYLNYINPKASDKQIKNRSFWVTSIIGIAVVIFAVKPPELLIMLNLFAFGGLESAFLWSVVFGLYWKKANKYGAISSMIVGLTLYIVIYRFAENIYGMHSVTIPIFASLITFVAVSLIAQKMKKIEDYHF